MNTNQNSKSKVESLLLNLSLIGYAIGDLCGISAALKLGQVIRVHGGATLLMVLCGIATALIVASLVIWLVWLSTSQRNRFDKIRRIIVQCVTVTTIIVMVFFLFVYRSSNMVAVKYADAFFHADADAIVRMIPDEVLDGALEEADVERRELVDALRDQIKLRHQNNEEYFGNELDYICTIVAEREVSGDALEAWQELYSEVGIDVTAARVMRASFFAKDGSDRSIIMDIPVIKVGSRWYLNILDMPGVLIV